MNPLTFFPTDVATTAQSSSIFQSKQMVEPERVCTQCGSTDTPLWRRGPHGPKTMCNRCGIRWKRKEDKKAGKKPNSNKKKKETTPKSKKIRTSSDREAFSSSSLSPTHDSDSWLSELDEEDDMEFDHSTLASRTKVITMGSEVSEPTSTDKESSITVNLTPKGENYTVDDGTFVRPEVPEPRRLSRDFININTSVNSRNETEPHDGMNLRKRKAKNRSSDFEYEWNATQPAPRRKSRQELLEEVRALPYHAKIFLEEAEAELKRIQKEEKENAEIARLNHLVHSMQAEITDLRQQVIQKDAMVSTLQEHIQKTQHTHAVLFNPQFRPFGGLYANSIPILPQQLQPTIQRVNLLPQSC
mmetsp:Transcript_13325/g.18359  ORF Transcript_13325/g.18359 Transcript_13325/m.18359 type:complete len:358 (+) Transcript_13325:216-1289(+)